MNISFVFIVSWPVSKINPVSYHFAEREKKAILWVGWALRIHVSTRYHTFQNWLFTRLDVQTKVMKWIYKHMKPRVLICSIKRNQHHEISIENPESLRFQLMKYFNGSLIKSAEALSSINWDPGNHQVSQLWKSNIFNSSKSWRNHQNLSFFIFFYQVKKLNKPILVSSLCLTK